MRRDACKTKTVCVFELLIWLKTRLGQNVKIGVVGYPFLLDEKFNLNKKIVLVRLLSTLLCVRAARASKSISLHAKSYSWSHILQDWASGLVIT